jgi:hypothetical protein
MISKNPLVAKPIPIRYEQSPFYPLSPPGGPFLMFSAETRRGVYIRQVGPRLFVLPILPTPVSVLEPLFERRPVGHHLSHDRTFAGPWVLVLRREDW